MTSEMEVVVNELAIAIRENLDAGMTVVDSKLYDIDMIERLVEHHQKQIPWRWQNWDFDYRVRGMAAVIRRATTVAGETSIERIFHKFC